MTGSLGSKVLEFGMGVVLARLLMPSDFGMLVTVQIFSGLAAFFAHAGLGQALIQAKDVDEVHFRVAFTLQLLLGIAVYLFFFFTAPLFAVWYNEPVFTDLMRVSTLTFLMRPAAGIASAKLSRQMRFKAQALIGFGTTIISGVSSIAMASAGMGFWSLVLSGILTGVFTSLSLCVAARWVPRFAFDKAVARSLGGFGAKILAADFLVYVREQVTNFMLGRMSSPAAVGLYNKADSLATMPRILISGSVYEPTFRALSAVQDNLSKSKYIYLRAVTLVLVYSLPIYVGLHWLAEPFMLVLFGPKWAYSAAPLSILALGGMFSCISNQSGAVVAAQRKLGKEIGIMLEAIVLLTAGLAITIPYSMKYVAVASLGCTVYLMLRMAGLALHCVNGKARELLAACRPGLLLSGIMWAVLAAGNALYFGSIRQTYPAIHLFGMTALGGVAYGLCFLFLPLRSIETEVGRWRSKLGLPLREPSAAAPESTPATFAWQRPASPWASLGASVLLLAAVLLFVHRLVQPLDDLWFQAVSWFSRTLG